MSKTAVAPLDNTQLDAILLRLNQVCSERTQLEARVKKLHDKIRNLRLTELQLQNERHALLIENSSLISPTSGLPSRNSMALLRAWAALHKALSDCRDASGLADFNVRAAIASSRPAMPDATVRSYLHRFKKKGLVSRRGSYWQLTGDAQARVRHEKQVRRT
jgi:hypothetical protein